MNSKWLALSIQILTFTKDLDNNKINIFNKKSHESFINLKMIMHVCKFTSLFSNFVFRKKFTICQNMSYK